MDVQTEFIFSLEHILEGTFSHVAAHITVRSVIINLIPNSVAYVILS